MVCERTLSLPASKNSAYSLFYLLLFLLLFLIFSAAAAAVVCFILDESP